MWSGTSSLCSLCCSLLSIAYASNDAAVADFGESGNVIFRTVYNSLTDIKGEAKLVLAVVGLVVVPQLLTYFLGGLSGSASPPVFVSQITDLAVLSLVKFLAAWSGIVAANNVWTWSHWHLLRHSPPNVRDVMAPTLLMLLPLAVAFPLMWMRYASRWVGDFLYRRRIFSPFRRVHEFFTRYSRSTPSETRE
jgi:hypothetical protein